MIIYQWEALPPNKDKGPMRMKSSPAHRAQWIVDQPAKYNGRSRNGFWIAASAAVLYFAVVLSRIFRILAFVIRIEWSWRRYALPSPMSPMILLFCHRKANYKDNERKPVRYGFCASTNLWKIQIWFIDFVKWWSFSSDLKLLLAATWYSLNYYCSDFGIYNVYWRLIGYGLFASGEWMFTENWTNIVLGICAIVKPA